MYCACRFRMVAVPGEAVVSTKVESLKKFKKVKLASSASGRGQLPLKRKAAAKVTVQTKKVAVNPGHQKATIIKKKLAMSGMECCLVKDFSEWAAALCIEHSKEFVLHYDTISSGLISEVAMNEMLPGLLEVKVLLNMNSVAFEARGWNGMKCYEDYWHPQRMQQLWMMDKYWVTLTNAPFCWWVRILICDMRVCLFTEVQRSAASLCMERAWMTLPSCPRTFATSGKLLRSKKTHASLLWKLYFTKLVSLDRGGATWSTFKVGKCIYDHSVQS